MRVIYKLLLFVLLSTVLTGCIKKIDYSQYLLSNGGKVVAIEIVHPSSSYGSIYSDGREVFSMAFPGDITTITFDNSCDSDCINELMPQLIAQKEKIEKLVFVYIMPNGNTVKEMYTLE